MTQEDAKYQINPHVRVIHVTPNEILVKHSARSFFSKSWTDKGRTGLLGRLINHMNGQHSLKELHENGVIKPDEYASTLQLVNELVEEHILIKPEHDLVDVYLKVIQGAETSLSDKRIGIIGCGQAGSRIAKQLAQCGIKYLLLSGDSKVHNATSLQRFLSIEPGFVTEGAAVADCLAASLKQYDLASISTITEDSFSKENIRAVFEQCDLVVAALDEYMQSILHTINQQALEAEKPWALTVFDGSEGIAGPIFVPGDTCCFNEFELQGVAAAGSLKRDVITYYDAVNATGQPDLGFAPSPYIDVVTGQLTSGLLNYLTTGRSFLVSRAIRTDFERMSVDYEDIKRIPRCSACTPFRPFRNVFL
ncbi:hypothetical protein EOE67_01860 [Rheinheimera riviphila]|uniref:THIF-type NAD/FAD binding fold domain-containing protein n=1 Tax=Rheinheimera riviphila TaxID=1834037 RepID=A0A437R597_9GAMM|nr:ThiF family adenylyltransferase [Rheinheimera riviphila]RVU41959.1 hypothetical protein EOE67_01860 [Rheinheimera riviphila]